MAIEYERVRFARGTEEEIENSPDMLGCEIAFCTDTNNFVIRGENGAKHKFVASNDISDFMDSKGEANGLAPLDENGKVDDYISSSLLNPDVAWDEVQDKPLSFTPIVHGEDLHSGISTSYSELTDIPSVFVPTTHDHTKHTGTLGLYSNLSLIPASFPPSAHGHDTINTFMSSKGEAGGLAPLDSLLTVNDYVTDVAIQIEESGTVPRNLTERFAEVFNVKDYGAVGDGSTDDTDAIGDTIIAAGAVSGVVYFPPGIYITGGNYCLNSLNGIKIYGAGIRCTQILITHESNDLFYVSTFIDGLEIANITFTSFPISPRDDEALGYSPEGLFIGGGRYMNGASSVVRTGGWVFNARETSWVGYTNTIRDIEIYGQFNGIQFAGGYYNVRLFNIIGMCWSGPQKIANLWQNSHVYTTNTVVVPPNEDKYWYVCVRGGTSTTAPSGWGTNGFVADGTDLLWYAFGNNSGGETPLYYWPGTRGYPSVWKANCSYRAGYIVFPTTPGNYWYYCSTAGESGSSEPSFSTTEGATVSDGGVVWTTFSKWDGPETGGVFIKLGKQGDFPLGWEALIDSCFCDGRAVIDHSMPVLAYGVYSRNNRCTRITNSCLFATTDYCVAITGDSQTHGVHYIDHCQFDSTAGSHLYVYNSRFFSLSNSHFYDSGAIDCGSPTAVNKVGDDTPSIWIGACDRNVLSNCIVQNSMGDAVQLITSSGTMTGFYIDCYGNGNVEGSRNGILIFGNGSFGQGWVISGCHVDNADPDRYPPTTNLGLAINSNSNKLVVSGNYFGEHEWHETECAVGTISVWTVGRNYYIGNAVLYEGEYFKCNTAHTSDDDPFNGPDGAYWDQVYPNIHNFVDV